jgi:hypothetical protein
MCVVWALLFCLAATIARADMTDEQRAAIEATSMAKQTETRSAMAANHKRMQDFSHCMADGGTSEACRAGTVK